MHHLSFTIAFLLITLSSNVLRAQKIDSLAFIEGITILFDSAEDELSIDDKNMIDDFIKDQELISLFRIEGHTDDVGSVEFNNKLAARRAKSVYNYLALIDRIDTTKIFYNSYGEMKPAKSNLNTESRKFNRRVDLSVYSQLAMRKIKGTVDLDSLDNTTIAKILVNGKNFRDSTFSTSEGNWSIVVPDSVFVTLDFSAPNYFFSSKKIKISQALDSRTIESELPKLVVGKEYDLPNLYFKSNLPILLPSSEPTLILLYGTMSTSDVCIHIKGHVNHPNEPPVSESHNYFKLSKARAQKIYDYMVEYGIDQNRMQRSGLGNWEMVYPKAIKESQMKKNRRVEIEIVECLN